MDALPHVSTGELPGPEVVAALVTSAHERFRSAPGGRNSQVYPSLAAADPGLLGICVAGTTGALHAAGDARHELAVMSVSKPFVFALVCQALGAEEVQARLGVNSTGRPFNSPEAVTGSVDGRSNPMVNPGAVAATSLMPGRSSGERWAALQAGLSAFAGRPLEVDEEIYSCAMESNGRTRALAGLLDERGRLYCSPIEAVELYTRQCCLSVTATDLAVMGATLADGGVNPLTGERVVDELVCHHTLAVMATAGMYEVSGDWLYEIGLPGKSGIGGGIVTVSPGKGGLGTFAPPLDAAGTSVRGKLVAGYLSEQLGLSLFASRPAR